MSISFGGVITRYISTSTKLKLKSNVVDICEWYRNVCVVQSCMHWDIPNRVPVVPVPIPTPSPLFLSPFPSPSPCYKISLTQSTNHQPVFFMSQNQVKVVGWTSYPSLIPESCLVWSIIRDVHNATSIHLVFLRNFCNYLPDVLSCMAILCQYQLECRENCKNIKLLPRYTVQEQPRDGSSARSLTPTIRCGLRSWRRSGRSMKKRIRAFDKKKLLTAKATHEDCGSVADTSRCTGWSCEWWLLWPHGTWFRHILHGQGRLSPCVHYVYTTVRRPV